MSGDIKTGAYVGENNGFLDGGSFLDRWDRAQNGLIQGGTAKDMLIYHDFYDYTSGFGTTGRIKNFDGVDVFERLADLETHTGKDHRILLTFNLQYDKTADASGKKGFRKANYGYTKPGGTYTADEHVAMIGRRMAEAYAAGSDFQRIRFFHEFQGRQKTDGSKGWCVYDANGNVAVPDSSGQDDGWYQEDFKKLWKRWVIILRGGTFSAIQSALSAAGVENPTLQIDTQKLQDAGYTGLVSSETLASNPDTTSGTHMDNANPGSWGSVHAGATGGAPNANNTYGSYYPGDGYVFYVGSSFFPAQDATKTDDRRSELTSIYDNYSVDGSHNKQFAISAYSRDLNANSTPNPGWDVWGSCGMNGIGTYDNQTPANQYAKLFFWAEARTAKVDWICAFEAVRTGACEDARVAAKKESDGSNAYPNHLSVSRNHLNGNSAYGFAS